MDTLILLALYLLAALALLGILFAIALNIYDPKKRRRRLLRQQARIEYASARGTAHLAILMQAHDRLSLQLKAAKKAFDEGQAALNKLQQAQQTELYRLIDTQIVQAHIMEIPGIGQRLAGQMISRVFQSRLSDLRRSQQYIQGIGESRQVQINTWILYWENQRPKLLEQGFVGKDAVIASYAEKIRSAATKAQKLQRQKEQVQANYEKAGELIQELKKVSATDFQRAIFGAHQNDPAIRGYLNGVFPEWEPMPAWFRDIITEE